MQSTVQQLSTRKYNLRCVQFITKQFTVSHSSANILILHLQSAITAIPFSNWYKHFRNNSRNKVPSRASENYSMTLTREQQQKNHVNGKQYLPKRCWVKLFYTKKLKRWTMQTMTNARTFQWTCPNCLWSATPMKSVSRAIPPDSRSSKTSSKGRLVLLG